MAEEEVTASPQLEDVEALATSFEELSVSKEYDNANLARLPDEIVLAIIKHLHRPSLKSLALTCKNLRRIVRPDFYRSRKHALFRQSLMSGDLDLLKRCAMYSAAPVDGVWKAEFRVYDSPMTECLDKDEITADQCFEVLQWLIDNDYDITAGSIDNRAWGGIETDAQIEFAKEMKHMPCSFLQVFKMSTDRDKLDGVARIVCHLSSQGFNFPRLVQGVGSTLRSKEEYEVFTPLSYDSPHLITMLMRSSCPPSLLEAFLKQLQRQGVKLSCPRNSCPAEFKYCEPVDDGDERFNPAPAILTQVWELVAELYNDLFDPQRWRPLSAGEIGDIWVEKVRLLDEYEGISNVERRLLVAILSALRKIKARAEASGGLEIERDAKACWYELCMSFQHFFDDDELLDSQFRHPQDRMHMFVLWVSWDPQRLWDQSLRKAPCGKFSRGQHRINGPVNIMSDWPQKWLWRNAGWLIDRDPDWCKIPLREW
ncbi:uncharacterized protein NECHADRAFT_74147 [Fusarium vanettenii 77-13-4]|uniref:F-box domain-containing protein n=1 Tax=Fusarium vanettenii (strain ATCC MYA-4622 / CBS 123669 / FGSC 9596 / NRRL 45880 / 77-13-4) TaxID=660122 RepID=C7YW14_FUSV7|nr:uncharacterized protein NECHADRAFT_74147 [Fusarium vanettenii 77-13-4]EEU44095.1 hypothetical protein NECHADRAFT_74147 [Fusarium vanettenii 77-13-4]